MTANFKWVFLCLCLSGVTMSGCGRDSSPQAPAPVKAPQPTSDNSENKPQPGPQPKDQVEIPPAKPIPPKPPEHDCNDPCQPPGDPAETAQAKELLEFLFSPPEDLDIKARTDALVVWKNGKIILEKYDRGYSAEKKHYLWSVSKSVSATIIGAAIHQQKLQLDDKVSKYIPLKDELSEMTVKNVIEWATGLDWQESYEGSGDQTKSSVGQLLYNQGAKDSVSYVINHPPAAAPGESFRYSTGDSTLLIGILKAVYQDDAYFPWTLLFDKLGIKAVFETDHRGQYLGGSGCYMTARDLLKIGELYLKKGEWNGERLLPEDFIAFAFGKNDAFTDPKAEGVFPGRHWWLNFEPTNPLRPRFDLPLDTVFALGHWGQTLTIIPSQNVLVVRFAHDLKKADGGRNAKEEYFKRLAAFLGVVP